MRNLGVQFGVTGVNMFQQFLLVSLQFLLELLEGRGTVAGGGLADGTLLDVPGQVEEVLLSGPQRVVGHGVHAGQRELVQVGVVVAAVGAGPGLPLLSILPLLAVPRLKWIQITINFCLSRPARLYPLFVPLETSIIFFAGG